MDAQMKQEVKDLYEISDSMLNKILEYPDKRVTFDNGRIFMYFSEHDMVAEVTGFSYKHPETEEELDSLKEYLKAIKDNDIQTLEEVIEEIGDTPIADDDVEVMERTKTNTEAIKNIWENI